MLNKKELNCSYTSPTTVIAVKPIHLVWRDNAYKQNVSTEFSRKVVTEDHEGIDGNRLYGWEEVKWVSIVPNGVFRIRSV